MLSLIKFLLNIVCAVTILIIDIVRLLFKKLVTTVTIKKEKNHLSKWKVLKIEIILAEFPFSVDDHFKNNHFDIKIPGW